LAAVQQNGGAIHAACDCPFVRAFRERRSREGWWSAAETQDVANSLRNTVIFNVTAISAKSESAQGAGGQRGNPGYSVRLATLGGAQYVVDVDQAGPAPPQQISTNSLRIALRRMLEVPRPDGSPGRVVAEAQMVFVYEGRTYGYLDDDFLAVV